jgi:hypothetical protein
MTNDQVPNDQQMTNDRNQSIGNQPRFDLEEGEADTG